MRVHKGAPSPRQGGGPFRSQRFPPAPAHAQAWYIPGQGEQNEKPRHAAGFPACDCAVRGQSSGVMFDACAPFGPWVTS